MPDYNPERTQLWNQLAARDEAKSRAQQKTEIGEWQRNITGTIFGGSMDTPQIGAYSKKPIYDTTPGVALPAHHLDGRWVEIKNLSNGKMTTAPVIDKGPHYASTLSDPGDPYWDTKTRPKAETRWPNRSGLDLTPKTATDVGMKFGRNKKGVVYGDGQFDWRFTKPPKNK